MGAGLVLGLGTNGASTVAIRGDRSSGRGATRISLGNPIPPPPGCPASPKAPSCCWGSLPTAKSPAPVGPHPLGCRPSPLQGLLSPAATAEATRSTSSGSSVPVTQQCPQPLSWHTWARSPQQVGRPRLSLLRQPGPQSGGPRWDPCPTSPRPTTSQNVFSGGQAWAGWPGTQPCKLEATEGLKCRPKAGLSSHPDMQVQGSRRGHLSPVTQGWDVGSRPTQALGSAPPRGRFLSSGTGDDEAHSAHAWVCGPTRGLAAGGEGGELR